MGLFDKNIASDHPLYAGSSLVSGISTPSGIPDESRVGNAPASPIDLDRLLGQLRDSEDATEIQRLLDSGAIPVGVEDTDKPNNWPLNEADKAKTEVLLWPTFEALAVLPNAPVKGELVFLSPFCSCTLDDYGDVLLSITDGYSGEASAALYVLKSNDLRVYYELGRDVLGVFQFDATPHIIAWAREGRKKQGHALDRKVAKWSAESGIIAKALIAFDNNFYDVKHEKDGPFERFVKL